MFRSGVGFLLFPLVLDIASFLDSDSTFVNKPLARLYGIEPLTEPGFHISTPQCPHDTAADLLHVIVGVVKRARFFLANSSLSADL
jgi:hypothetical protein